MKYYREIKLFDETEISLGFLWSKLYTQIHLALVEIKDENDRVDVGVSFPKYGDMMFPLGDTLRLFAPSKERMEALRLEHYLHRLMDYVSLSPIKEVPEDVKEHAIFKRIRFKSNAQIRRLAKQKAKKSEHETISYEMALKEYKEVAKKYEKLKCDNKLPYINVQSISNNNRMKLFIKKIVSKEEKVGYFSTYGLSIKAPTYKMQTLHALNPMSIDLLKDRIKNIYWYCSNGATVPIF